MGTTKQKRKYSQDFSGNSLTDESFAAACDVNAIVRHYQETGIDPHIQRKQLERFTDATTQTYSEAMQHTSEIDSAFALLPSQERAQHANDPRKWLDAMHDAQNAQESLTEPPDSPAKPPPEDASEDNSEAKVQ